MARPQGQQLQELFLNPARSALVSERTKPNPVVFNVQSHSDQQQQRLGLQNPCPQESETEGLRTIRMFPLDPELL